MSMRIRTWIGAQLLALVAGAYGQEVWTSRNPLPTTQELPSVVWTGNQLVAVGLGVLTSPDGIVWTKQSFQPSTWLNDVTWTGSQLVAVGLSTVLTSPDGVDWTKQKLPSRIGSLQSVVWTGSQLVAVGSGIATSPDGVNWTQRDSSSAFFRSVAWSGSRCVAVGYNGAMLVSPDGVTWSAPDSGTIRYTLMSVAWTGSLLVATATNGTVLTSPDGSKWTQRNTGLVDGRQYLSSLTWAGTRLVGILQDGSGFMTSPDGITWTVRKLTTDAYPMAMAWTGTKLVAVGGVGTFLTSPDGVDWTDQCGAPATDDLNAVAWSGGQLVAVGGRGTIITSPDGVNWTSRKSGTLASLMSVIATDTGWVAGGDSDTYLTSKDGGTWTVQRLGSSSRYLASLAWSGSKLVAVEDYSPDVGGVAAMWDGEARVATWDETTIRSVIWAGNQFVAVGEGCPGTGNWYALVMTSTDGRTWTKHYGQPRQILKSVTWTGSRLLATGYDADNDTGVAYSSPDGIDWTNHRGGGDGATIWAGTQFVRVGSEAFTSPDGVTWTNRNSGTPGALKSVVSTGSQLVAVGLNGTILTSPLQNTAARLPRRVPNPSVDRGVYSPFRLDASFTAAGRRVDLR